ncbi:hypothetical protein [Ponticoccus litoralis]|uniref:Uncharacterized protein n=1 Tax=Ponticoccus litoralis TaxID=422297 RepID=A0AAW9SFG8_9RHOB
MPAPLPASSRTRVVRSIAIGVSLSLALVASGLLFEASLQDGMDWLDWFRAVLILITTAWLAWGASLAFAGLAPRARAPRRRSPACSPRPCCSCRSATRIRLPPSRASPP